MHRFVLAAERSAVPQALVSAPCCQFPKNCLHLKRRLFFLCVCVIIQHFCEMKWWLYFYFFICKWFFPWSMCCSFTWNEDCTKLNFFLGFLEAIAFENNWSGNWGATLKECCCLFLWRQLHICVLKFFQSLLLTRDAENTEAAKFSF